MEVALLLSERIILAEGEIRRRGRYVDMIPRRYVGDTST
jgi:hypothetical protein